MRFILLRPNNVVTINAIIVTLRCSRGEVPKLEVNRLKLNHLTNLLVVLNPICSECKR